MITEREEFAGKTTNGESKLPNGKTMTRDNIIRMAREAGDWNGQTAEFNDVGLERFAALVAAQNRPWVGLTDEEIKSLPSWWPSYEDAPALIQLVKDVEAKLREKNT
jgi:hypothetical protein